MNCCKAVNTRCDFVAETQRSDHSDTAVTRRSDTPQWPQWHTTLTYHSDVRTTVGSDTVTIRL